MPGMINARALWKVVRAGHPRARLRATRDGLVAMRLHLGAAAVETGLLDVLAEGDATTAELAERLGAVDEDLLVAFLRVAASVGLLSGGEGRPWHLTRPRPGDRGRRPGAGELRGLLRAAHRHLPADGVDARRRGTAPRRGRTRRADRALSQGFEPLVMDVLTRAVTERRPRRVLDIGCGAGLELAAMLEAAPGAHGVGVDLDADAADLAEQTLRERGLAGRSAVVRSDVREPSARATGPLSEPFDLALLANVIYYLPMAERVPLLRDVAGLLVARRAADPGVHRRDPAVLQPALRPAAPLAGGAHGDHGRRHARPPAGGGGLPRGPDRDRSSRGDRP